MKVGSLIVVKYFFFFFFFFVGYIAGLVGSVKRVLYITSSELVRCA